MPQERDLAIRNGQRSDVPDQRSEVVLEHHSHDGARLAAAEFETQLSGEPDLCVRGGTGLDVKQLYGLAPVLEGHEVMLTRGLVVPGST